MIGATVALVFDPLDLIEEAARDENWTPGDRRNCEQLLQELEGPYQVKMLQRREGLLTAWDSTFSNFESLTIERRGRDKPVLDALRELAGQLQERKLQSERSDDL
jgi:hypothetical protein